MLEAGLAAYQGKALVNSVTAEDERLDAILPLVKRHGAAVIALPNDEEEIPEEPARRLELARKIVDVATGRYGIPIEDIVFDPLAMPVGADTSLVLTTLETISLLRDEFGVNMTLGASNVSFGMPDRHAIGAAFLPMAVTRGLTSAIMDARSPQLVRRGQGGRPADQPGPVGRGLDRRAPAPARPPRPRPTASRNDRWPTQVAGAAPPPVDLTFAPSGTRVRVPPGVTVFDAASWNGIAIDSTCGGHGTCKKCKVADRRAACRPRRWTRARSRPTSCGRAGGWPAGRWRTPTCRSRCRRWSPGPRRRPSGSAARSSCGRPRRSATWSWPSRR